MRKVFSENVLKVFNEKDYEYSNFSDLMIDTSMNKAEVGSKKANEKIRSEERRVGKEC